MIGALGAIVGGIVIYLVAPWVHWGIEQRRIRTESRRALIAEAREYIGSESFYGSDLVRKPIYPRLKPHLAPDIIEVIENYEEVEDQQDDPESFPEVFRKELLDEISRLERTWGLI
ncbi:MAG: hypothetical protein ACRET3_06820 [Burkholderiales bacterium]